MTAEGHDAGPNGAPAPPRLGIAELSPATRAELLDAAAWREGLEQYARAMRLAVAVADADGRLLGECLNPQPLWGLLHANRPAAGGCPFCLATLGAGTCVADALRSGVRVLVRDRTGLVHFAVPLTLGGQQLGALVAGQVFDQYPAQLPLERVARDFGLPPSDLWQRARRERPVSRATLDMCVDLLTTLGNAFLHSRYHAHLERVRLGERDRAEELLRQAHAELERRVEERTAELQEAQRKALQAERLAAIGQMVAGLAHESRNALQRGQACLSMLGFRLQGQPEALDLVNRAQKAQDDLHRLYEDVREYAAPIRLDPRVCDLAQVWREAWADLGSSRAGRGAELREETGGVDLHCRADPFQLKQVFRNLLDNALGTGADPVRVVIRCARAEIGGREAVRVAVRDNGPGISPEQRQRMFEPFHTTKLRGTGLGLAICKRIVEAHGGLIALGDGTSPVTDPAPDGLEAAPQVAGGAGAEFLVTLPRRSET